MVVSTSKALNQLNFLSFSFVFIDGLSLPSFLLRVLYETVLANPMLAEFRVNVGCRKGPLQPESSKRACNATGYSDEMGNRGGTLNAIKDSRLG
jgi:hypothetical protein